MMHCIGWETRCGCYDSGRILFIRLNIWKWKYGGGRKGMRNQILNRHKHTQTQTNTQIQSKNFKVNHFIWHVRSFSVSFCWTTLRWSNWNALGPINWLRTIFTVFCTKHNKYFSWWYFWLPNVECFCVNTFVAKECSLRRQRSSISSSSSPLPPSLQPIFNIGKYIKWASVGKLTTVA